MVLLTTLLYEHNSILQFKKTLFEFINNIVFKISPDCNEMLWYLKIEIPPVPFWVEFGHFRLQLSREA